MSETATATVDHHDDLTSEKPETLCSRLIKDVFDKLDFDKVIARSDRTELVAATCASTGGDACRIRFWQAAFCFAVQEICVFAKTVFDGPRRSTDSEFIEVFVSQA